ncbi:FecR family protein [Pseudomonas aeruginosa]
MAGGAVAWVGRDSLPWQRLSADYSTATGERRSIELVDGTRLQLNTDSAVDVRYDAGQRLILLARGEIFPPAAPIRNRPRTGRCGYVPRKGAFEALGTRFNVRPQDAATCLSVSEGSVRIDAFGARPLQAPVAEAGQSLSDRRRRRAAPRTAADGRRGLGRWPHRHPRHAPGRFPRRGRPLPQRLPRLRRGGRRPAPVRGLSPGRHRQAAAGARADPAGAPAATYPLVGEGGRRLSRAGGRVDACFRPERNALKIIFIIFVGFPRLVRLYRLNTLQRLQRIRS